MKQSNELLRLRKGEIVDIASSGKTERRAPIGQAMYSSAFPPGILGYVLISITFTMILFVPMTTGFAIAGLNYSGGAFESLGNWWAWSWICAAVGFVGTAIVLGIMSLRMRVPSR